MILGIPLIGFSVLSSFLTFWPKSAVSLFFKSLLTFLEAP